METLTKIVGYVLDYIAAVPTSSWVALGTLLSGSAIVTGVVAWINRHRLKKGVEKLGRAMVTWVVTFLAALVSVLDFIINNGSVFGSFLPYFATHTVQVIGISTTLYNVAKPTLAWFRARKNGEPITNLNLNYSTPVPDAVLPSSSFGTEATGRSTDLLR